ncbi:unnamed protein product [Cyclocybe aegerita]|uniref:Uncharacterized protein n=1 Tax=Cyclocybe aegerita TaxID=1973307 RepID=A0A8S0WQ31_CYCAE|nr:unnamed protein product [Cyclocybe aegerita]
MSGKEHPWREIYVNKQLCHELLWLANHLKSAPPIFMLNSIDWPLNTADYILFTNSCLYGMAFWSPAHNIGFQCAIDTSEHPIFYWEAYTVVSAFSWIVYFCCLAPRAGGATHYAITGVPSHIIHAMGCWKSDTFEIYICQHPALLTVLLFSSTTQDNSPV